MINKDSNISLHVTSQKVSGIEKSSQLRARKIEEDTIFKNVRLYSRNKKGGKETGALGEHTLAQLKVLNFDVDTLHSSLDASQVNAQM